MIVEHIESPVNFDGDEGRIATIVRRSTEAEPNGIQCFTETKEYLQTIYGKYPRGHAIPAHIHNVHRRVIDYTQEVLFFYKGRARIVFYTSSERAIEEVEVSAGDVVIIFSGGHSIQMLEDTEFFEVKQGPYLGRAVDKRDF